LVITGVVAFLAVVAENQIETKKKAHLEMERISTGKKKAKKNHFSSLLLMIFPSPSMTLSFRNALPSFST